MGKFFMTARSGAYSEIVDEEEDGSLGLKPQRGSWTDWMCRPAKSTYVSGPAQLRLPRAHSVEQSAITFKRRLKTHLYGQSWMSPGADVAFCDSGAGYKCQDLLTYLRGLGMKPRQLSTFISLTVNFDCIFAHNAICGKVSRPASATCTDAGGHATVLRTHPLPYLPPS